MTYETVKMVADVASTVETTIASLTPVPLGEKLAELAVQAKIGLEATGTTTTGSTTGPNSADVDVDVDF